MIQRTMTEFAIKHPKVVIGISVVITFIFLAAFPNLKTDTDPVHMLPSDNSAVVLYESMKKEFKIDDIVALGIKAKDGSSLFTKDGLNKIKAITDEILLIENDKTPPNVFTTIIDKLKFLDTDHGKDDDGPIFVKKDVISVSTVDDITKNENGELLVSPIMGDFIETDEVASRILSKLNNNPMLGGKMTSEDGSVVGVFIPLREGMKEKSYYLSLKVKEIAKKHLGENEQYYFAGLPLAESTFGSEMFIQMAVYAPFAGLVIFLLMLFFFRSVKIVIAPMILGVMVVIWSMGALIYSGNVIHIMSSMIPIFLLPIAVLNSIHILSKLSDKMKDFSTKEETIRYVMKELFNPMLFTSFTTIVGFVSLSTTGIPPVVVFGVTIGFGVFLSWLLSMFFIPSYTMLMNDAVLQKFALEKKSSVVVEFVKNFSAFSWKFPKPIIVVSILIIFVSIYGVTKIIINDNPVRWFKSGHELRIADLEMNESLAGTYMANLYLSIPSEVIATKDVNEEGSGDFDDEFSEEEDVLKPSIRDPMVVSYIENISNHIKTVKGMDGALLVGGVTSISDVLRKIGDVATGDRTLPKSREQVSQYIFLFESGDIKKGKDLWKLITPSESFSSQMWVYMKSGDNQNMSLLISSLEKFMEQNPPPQFVDSQGNKHSLEIKWSGLMAINNVWQNLMVDGMVRALTGSFIIVFFMMVFLFRSIKWGVIAMLPLTITILFIYGTIGYTGKFYDMPIAILSSLTLGLSIDFAIHFIEHVRLFNSKYHDFSKTYNEMFNGTAQAIWRNVLVISVGFFPLFFAGLVPYVTVGSFFFAIMLVSGVTTLILMPAILKVFHPWLLVSKEKS